MAGEPDELEDAARQLSAELAEFIAANVRELRRARGLTQKQLGDELGVKVASITEIEGARYRPGLLMLCKLAVVFGVRPQDLLVPKEMDGARRRGRPVE